MEKLHCSKREQDYAQHHCNRCPQRLSVWLTASFGHEKTRSFRAGFLVPMAAVRTFENCMCYSGFFLKMKTCFSCGFHHCLSNYDQPLEPAPAASRIAFASSRSSTPSSFQSDAAYADSLISMPGHSESQRISVSQS